MMLFIVILTSDSGITVLSFFLLETIKHRHESDNEEFCN